MLPKSDHGHRGRARAQSLTVSLSLWAITAMGVLRLGWLDHDWLLAGVIVVLAAAGLPITLRLLKRRDLQALQHSPAGTLFVGGANLVGSELRREARFAEAVSDWRRGWMTGGYIGGTLGISEDKILFTPGPWSGRGVRAVAIRLSEVADVSALKLPAKFNVASLGIRLAEGSRLTLQVRGFDRLQRALEHLRVQHALPLADAEPRGI